MFCSKLAFLTLLILGIASYSFGFDSVYLKGKYEPNQMGGFTYNIPVEISPGAGGLQPSLSFSYNSQGGNGLLGMGWGLSGLSIISRCNATRAQDGFIGSVSLNSNDRFCLDGAKLIAVNGAYGGNGTEYRTENENFERIFSYQISGTGPSYFIAYTKSGQKLTYGLSSDSKVVAQDNQNIVVWAVNFVGDLNGNFYTIQYQNDSANGQYYPLAINYTGNTVAGGAPPNSIRFYYTSRPDLSPVYRGNVKLSTIVRMTNIQTYVNGERVYDYQLSYQQSGQTGRSLLTGVTVVSSDGSKSLLPTIFGWNGPAGTYSSSVGLPAQTLAAGVSIPASYAGGVGSGNSGSGIYNNVNSQWISGDFNGDGITDFIQPSKGSKTVPVCFGTLGGINFDCVNFGLQSALNGSGDFIAGDFDGDGKVDFAQVDNNSNVMVVYYSQGDGHFSAIQKNMPGLAPIASGLHIGVQYKGSSGDSFQYVSMDFDGDGLSDTFELATNGANPEICYSKGRGQENDCYNVSFPNFSPVNVIMGDFDGDGRIDIGYAPANPYWNGGAPGMPSGPLDNGLEVCYSNGGGSFSCELKDSLPNYGHRSCGGHNLCYGPFFTGDFNGDGTSDVAQFSTNGTIAVYLSTGRGIQPTYSDNLFANIQAWSDSPFLVADLNGDGKSDIITKSSLNLTEICYSNGDGNFSCTAGPTISQSKILFGNFNGDTNTSIVEGNLSDSTLTIYKNPFLYPDLLSSVQNGIGALTLIEYKTLTDSSIYNKFTGSSYPLQDTQAPLWVVSILKQDDGNGTQRERDYKYLGAKIDLDGRGFLGFSEIDQIDVTGKSISKTKFLLDFPYTGQIKEFSKFAYVANSNKYAQALNNFYLYDHINYSGNRSLVSLLSKQEISYDINSGALISNNIVKNAYDIYGNLINETTVTNDGFSKQKKIKVSNFTSDPSTNPSGWYLGRVEGVEEKNTNPDGTSLTRSKSYAYNNIHQITQEKVEPNNSKKYITMSYSYDAFGNVIQRSISGNDMFPRSEITTYDLNGQFPITKKNSYNHLISYVYNPKFGVPTQITDENSLITTISYDGLGRKINETRPDSTQTNISYAACSIGVCATGQSYYIQILKTGTATNVVYFDSLDREVASQSGGFNSQPIYKFKHYDEIGNLQWVSNNTFSTPNKYTTFSYDVLNRAISQTNPDGTQKTFSYSGLTQTAHNGNGKSKVETKNTLGQVIYVLDDSGKKITYTYDPFGNLTSTTDSSGNKVSVYYDILGHKTKKTESNSGTSTYLYNAVGDLISTTDANGKTISSTYDNLGRLQTQITSEGTSTWIYDSAAHGIGKISSVSNDAGYSKIYSYDLLGRSSSSQITMDTSYVTTTSYDSASRISQITYPTGFAVKYQYDTNGYLKEIDNAATDALIWKATSANENNSPLTEVFGNNITSTKTYYAETGRLQRIVASTAASDTVQDLNLSYDNLGNLTGRTELINQTTGATVSETFSYDNLNRLTSISGPSPKTFSYDDLGNLASKSDVGNYAYGNGTSLHPIHSVASTSGLKNLTFSYDKNGNMLGGNGRTMTWSTFNKPLSISNSVNTINFSYDPTQERYKEIESTCKDYHGVSSSTCIKYVINPAPGTGVQFEKEINGSVVTFRNYLYAGSNMIGVYITTSDGATNTRYFHKDHQSTINLITDEAGAVVERFSYDAFGKRRNLDGSDDPYNALRSLITHQGFTLQQHLDDGGLALVHMNGRVYDPFIGQFLAADPIIKDVTDLQALNSYSYVQNNPLTLVDPSGYFSLSDIGNFVSDAVRSIGDFIGHTYQNIASAINDTGKWLSNNWRMIVVVIVVAVVTYVSWGTLTGAMAGALGAYGAGVVAGMAIGAFAGALYSTVVNERFSWNSVFAGAVIGAAVGGLYAGGWAAAKDGGVSVLGGALANGYASWTNGNHSLDAFAEGFRNHFKYADRVVFSFALGIFIQGFLTGLGKFQVGEENMQYVKSYTAAFAGGLALESGLDYSHTSDDEHRLSLILGGLIGLWGAQQE